MSRFTVSIRPSICEALVAWGALSLPTFSSPAIAQDTKALATSENIIEWGRLLGAFESASQAHAELKIARQSKLNEDSLNQKIKNVVNAEVLLGQLQVDLESHLQMAGSPEIIRGELQFRQDIVQMRLKELSPEIVGGEVSGSASPIDKHTALVRELKYLRELHERLVIKETVAPSESRFNSLDRSVAMRKFEKALEKFCVTGREVVNLKSERHYKVLHDEQVGAANQVKQLRHSQEEYGRKLTDYVLTLESPIQEAAFAALRAECRKLEGEIRGLKQIDYSWCEFETILASERSIEAKIQLEYLRDLAEGKRPFSILAD